MTDQELKNLVAGLAIQSKKTDAQLAKTDAQLAETNRALKIQNEKTDAQMAETNRALKIQNEKTAAQMADTNRTLKNLGIDVGGISKTNGEIAQEFFTSSLGKTPELAGIAFDVVRPNVLSRKKDRSHEMDIFMENGDSVGIVEVKSKVRADDIERLKNTVASFYEFHPLFKHHKIYAGLAGKVFPKHLQELALKQGFVVLTQRGDHVEQRLPPTR